MKKLFFLILSLLIVPYLGKGQYIHIYHMEFGHRDEYSSTKYIATSSRKLIEDQNTRATNSYTLPLDSIRIVDYSIYPYTPPTIYIAQPGQKKKEWRIINNLQLSKSNSAKYAYDFLLKQEPFKSISIKTLFPVQSKKRVTLQKFSGEMVILDFNYSSSASYSFDFSELWIMTNHDYSRIQRTFSGKYGYTPMDMTVKTKNGKVVTIPQYTKVTCDSVGVCIPHANKWDVNIVCHIDTIKDIVIPYDQSAYNQSLLLSSKQYNNISYSILLNQKKYDSLINTQHQKLLAEQQQKIEEEKTIQEKRLKEAKQADQRKSEILKKYGKYYGELILAGKVKLGMTKQMCIEAWGQPEDINRTIVQGNINEQWVYSLDCYLYFDNGILTAIQD